ncbi:MAG: hypothetical protein EZS28_023046 [Streblomastix strix]|uniref:C2 domain-containing protein n=1 Tax=Streblomastix strix TaxID=222440 RepID=A0A5J4VGG1_9EUKA|nr:MAG: hypothetical protein EZS28_023046 [Streblomastix strix]
MIQENKDESIPIKQQEQQIASKNDLEIQKRVEDERIKLEAERKKKGLDSTQFVRGIVKFSHISVKNLVKKDVTGKSDPYVLFRVGNEEKQTSIAKNTLNYEYKNEAYELIYDPLAMQDDGIAQIEVYDYDKMGNNDLIGVANVDILRSLNKQMSVELSLKPKLGQKQSQSDINQQQPDYRLGKVIFRMLYSPVQEQSKNKKEDQTEKNKNGEENINIKQFKEFRKNKEADLAQYVKGNIKLSHISVRNLPKMDIGGKADPFVVFRMGDEEKKTTTAKNTLNYDYINESYELIYDPQIMNLKKEIDVEVFDYDSIGINDLIGIASIDILPSMNQQIEVELFLQPKKEKKDTQNRPNLTSQLKDQGLGKVVFWMLYTPDENQIIDTELVNERKRQQEEEMNEQIENMKKDGLKQRAQRGIQQTPEKETVQQQQQVIDKQQAQVNNNQQALYSELEQETYSEAEQAQYNRGMVRISNVSVRDIQMMDGQNQLFPFVNFCLGNIQRQTSVAENTVNNDYLNERIELIYDPEKLKGQRAVEVQVWNYSEDGNNNLIGTAIIDILAAYKQQMEIELYLQPKKAKEDQSQPDINQQQDQGIGKVTFWMIFLPEDLRLKSWREAALYTARSQREQLSSMRQSEQSLSEYVRGFVNVTVLSIHDPPDFCITDNRSIFVQLMLGVDQRKSRILQSDVDVIVEEDFSIWFDPDEITERDLFIEVWMKTEQIEGEEMPIEEDQFLGGVAVEFIDYLNNPQQLNLQLVGDATEEDTNSLMGEVTLNIVYIPQS